MVGEENVMDQNRTLKVTFFSAGIHQQLDRTTIHPESVSLRVLSISLEALDITWNWNGKSIVLVPGLLL